MGITSDRKKKQELKIGAKLVFIIIEINSFILKLLSYPNLIRFSVPRASNDNANIKVATNTFHLAYLKNSLKCNFSTYNIAKPPIKNATNRIINSIPVIIRSWLITLYKK